MQIAELIFFGYGSDSKRGLEYRQLFFGVQCRNMILIQKAPTVSRLWFSLLKPDFLHVTGTKKNILA